MFCWAEAYVLMDYLVSYKLHGYIWFGLLAQKQDTYSAWIKFIMVVIHIK